SSDVCSSDLLYDLWYLTAKEGIELDHLADPIRRVSHGIQVSGESGRLNDRVRCPLSRSGTTSRRGRAVRCAPDQPKQWSSQLRFPRESRPEPSGQPEGR